MTEKESNPVGRPLAYKTVQDLDQAISAYFDLCDPHTQRRLVDCGMNDAGETIWRSREVLTEQQPYTVSGLARALGIDRDTLINYRNRDEFFGSVQAAYERCHEFAESQLYGRAQSGAAFSLKNNWGWEDKKQVDHTTKGQPMPLLGGTTPMVDDDEEETDEPNA